MKRLLLLILIFGLFAGAAYAHNRMQHVMGTVTGMSDTSVSGHEGGHGMSTANGEHDTPQHANSAIERITSQHARFINFLTARVTDRAAAEDLLQSAYLKAIERGGEIRDDESTVAWFYRILRNAVTDSYRRQSARTRAQESFAAEAPQTYELELEPMVCACVGDVMQNLKSEYREAIQQVDLDGITVQSFAESHGTSANNASVRLHRARKDLAKKLTAVCGACAEHKCLDCTCRRSQLQDWTA